MSNLRGSSLNLFKTSLTISFFFSWTIFRCTLNIHNPFKRFSVIVDLSHVLTRRRVEKDLSILLVVHGCANDISMAFLVAGKKVSASFNTSVKSNFSRPSLSIPLSFQSLYHNS
jgi:hypothetical protein